MDLAVQKVWSGVSRRRVPRFKMQAPLDVTVLRSGVPDTLPGRCVNVGERGVAAILAGEVAAGEVVGIEMRLSPSEEPLRARATVRYHDVMRCGLQFEAISPEQRAAIRNWTKEALAEAEGGNPSLVLRVPDSAIQENHPAASTNAPGTRFWRSWWFLACVVLAIAGVLVLRSRWNRGWKEIESGLAKSQSSLPASGAQVHVPAEVMQKLVVHRVDPEYPPEARKENLQGIIAIDIVVGKDGSVLSMRPLNGPEVLSRAAMDALRWWKFAPYRVNGEPIVVETTVAIEFEP